MKTDFKALVENAKLQVAGETESLLTETQDSFAQLASAQNTFLILEENNLDSTNVQFLEIALVEQIINEADEDLADTSSSSDDGGDAKPQGFFGKIWAAIAKFFKMIWDFLTMKNRDIPGQFDTLIKKFEAKNKAESEGITYNKIVADLTKARDSAKQFFTTFMPRIKTQMEKANAKAKAHGSDSKKGKAALQKVKDLKINVSKATAKYVEMIAAGKKADVNAEDGARAVHIAVSEGLLEINKFTNTVRSILERIKALF